MAIKAEPLTIWLTGADDWPPLPISAACCGGTPTEAGLAGRLADLPGLALVSTSKCAVARVGRAAKADCLGIIEQVNNT